MSRKTVKWFMHKSILIVALMLSFALAQEEIFGYEVLNDPLEPAVTSYIGREVWAYGRLQVYCQNPINTQQVSRFYYTSPKNKLAIQNLSHVNLPEDSWQRIIHVNGGFTQPMDHSGVSSETAFLLTLNTESPILNEGSASDGSLSQDELYTSCQEFFTVVLPQVSYLERIFSFIPFEEIAEQQGWTDQEVRDVLDVYASVSLGMTRDMVLWKLGAPLNPLNLDEAHSAGHWSYLSYVPFSHNMGFDQDGKVSKYSEGRLP
jgi:hypothetical protein